MYELKKKINDCEAEVIKTSSDINELIDYMKKSLFMEKTLPIKC